MNDFHQSMMRLRSVEKNEGRIARLVRQRVSQGIYK